MTDAVIDRAVFAELQDTAGADFVVELVDSFLEDAPPMLAALRRAAETGDADGFRRQAHSLKSNATTFGATALSDAARALEHVPLAELGAAAAARVQDLAVLYEQAAQVLRELRHA
jgi:HPt (histidine-containing phosphotransfer) domain-containing protein